MSKSESCLVEIKFRAWDKKDKKYYYFDLFSVPDVILKRKHDEVVIERFSGFQDEQKDDIYEGDLLEFWKETYSFKDKRDKKRKSKKIIHVMMDEIEGWGCCSDLGSFIGLGFFFSHYCIYRKVGNVNENGNLLTK